MKTRGVVALQYFQPKERRNDCSKVHKKTFRKKIVSTKKVFDGDLDGRIQAGISKELCV